MLDSHFKWTKRLHCKNSNPAFTKMVISFAAGTLKHFSIVGIPGPFQKLLFCGSQLQPGNLQEQGVENRSILFLVFVGTPPFDNFKVTVGVISFRIAQLTLVPGRITRNRGSMATECTRHSTHVSRENWCFPEPHLER